MFLFRSLARAGIASLLALSFLTPAFAGDPAADGHALAVRMDEVDNSRDSLSVGEMTIERDGKKLLRTFDLYTLQVKPGKEEEHVLFVFNKPADVKGTKYLEWTYEGNAKEDDLWVYLPAESMVRRISGSSKQASFMRSDMTNEDLESLDDVEEFTYELKGEETMLGIDCWVLVRYPKPGKNTGYSKMVQWVRKDNLLRRRMDYYDKKGKMIKTMYFDECRVIDGIPTVTKSRVVRADGRSVTTIDWKSIRYNVGLKKEIFEHSQLHR
ncbi:MAG: outer membrane lipoprotein-sorting protein [Desulfovibrio sp.]|nr:outer membrane lipoprotein-sorting protein [Desulfovibrio sp.]